MNFSKFRASGDLTDITVFVDKNEFKLHKFPLYAKSDFFCERARSKADDDTELLKVELQDFPGGGEIFGQVADFCYNIPLSLNKKNAVAIRCAAEYLKMSGHENLIDVSGKFLMDEILSAKRNRSISTIISMLMDCNGIGNLAKTAGIVDTCLEAFIECWKKPVTKSSTLGNRHVPPRMTTYSNETSSAFIKIQAQSCQLITMKLDESVITYLVALRADWFALLISKAHAKGISSGEIGVLAVRYITSLLDKDDGNAEQCSTDSLNDEEIGNKPITIPDDEKDIDTISVSSSDAQLDVKQPEVVEDVLPTRPHAQFDTGKALDSIVLVLPHEAFYVPSVTLEWLIKTLHVATDQGCECRSRLLRLIGEKLTKLDPGELSVISPVVLHDIVQDAGDKECEAISRMLIERACKLVDTYLIQTAQEGNLTSDTFYLLASASKDYPRQTYDSLYNVLEIILKSENDKLTKERRIELSDLINFDLLSERSLQKAMDEEVVPANIIAVSALKLCARLRSELASVKCIAQIQEEDIQKYQTTSGASSTMTFSAPVESEPKITSWQRATDSGLIEPLDDSAEKTSSVVFKTESHDVSNNYHQDSDPLKAAENVLTAARHKLALPVYTGYRPLSLSYLYSHHPQRGHDISLGEEQEIRFDRSFQSLDPRIRNYRSLQNCAVINPETEHRIYFPYSNYSHRY